MIVDVLDRVVELETLGQFDQLRRLIRTLPFEKELSVKLVEVRILLKQGYFKEVLSKAEEIYDGLQHSDNPVDIAELILLMSEMQSELGNPTQSKYNLDKVPAIIDRIDSKPDKIKSTVRYNIVQGLYHNSISEFKEATEFFNIALKLSEPIGDEFGVSTALYNLGKSLQKQGKLSNAHDKLNESLIIREKIGNPYDILDNLNNIGIVYARQGHFEDAISIFERSLGICEDIDDNHKKSMVLNNLGNIAKIRGNLRQASFYQTQSLKISEQMGDMSTFISSSINLGSIELERGDLDSALNIYSKILPLLKKSENKHGLAIVFNNIGLAYEKKGELNSARDYYQIGLNIRNNLGNDNDIGKSLQNVGKICLLQGKLDDAYTNLSNAYEIFDTNKNYTDLSEVSLKLGMIYSKRGEYEYAEQHMMKSLKLRKALENELLESDTLFFLIILCSNMDEPKKAEKYLKDLKNIAKNSKNKVIKTRHKLAEASLLQTSHKMNKKVEAHDIFEEVVSEDLVDFELTVFAMLNLCEFLLIELKSNNDERTLKELEALVTKLYEIAQDQESYDIMCEVLIIQSKLALLEGKYKEANFLIDQAVTIADERNIHQIKIKSTFIKNQLEKQLDKWSDEVFVDLPYSERIDELDLQKHFKEVYDFKENAEMFVHDIKNFLQMNLNITKMIALNESLPEELREYVDMLDRSGRELQMHISSFMTQERLVNSSYNLNIEQLCLHSLIEERIELFKIKIISNKLEIELWNDINPFEIATDRFLLSRILDNLIHNAVKFAPKESIIIVELNRAETEYSFSISNDGAVIPKEDQDRLFKKYQQINKNSSKGGFGLGLTFCKKAIEVLGGEIYIESPRRESLNGVTLNVKLPRPTLHR